ncbi:transmembrane small multi-drug resistance protein, putative [Heliomicrobium modesticaldum Ice1]|uniref:Transmembrane small multi-drug resistance protein, putative n=1 Tax=Heliobacterium modesticaldum (strain ATCC 51547 / Ice1) TaxID=498761 RepID=B0THF6_HELMI|nr:EamA family transporter [Heliomicrobium modesticaldum]ABZ83394.1 transmembrane small multi-drug resistance protein, putative [Heliomicrobium modesticaldum Ice1]
MPKPFLAWDSLLLIAINITLLLAGQTLWKIGLQKIGGFSLAHLPAAAFSPWIVAGLVLYVIATGVWFLILSRIDFSLAYPLQSLAFVFGVFLGWLVFQETIPWTRWVGVAVIIFGVYLVALPVRQ